MSAPLQAAPRLLDGLPLCDPAEVEGATGFVRAVRSLVTIPLTSLGLIAVLAALVGGNFVAAGLAAAATLGVVVSLVRDTRLSVALDRLRTGRLAEAEQGMQSLVHQAPNADRQRRRAEAYLAAIAWARGDHATALKWTRLRGETLRRTCAADDECYLNDASAILLLALCGRHRDAEAALGELGPAPMGDRWGRAEAAAWLSVAFMCDDVEPVRARLDTWRPLCGPHAPLISAWLAWAFDRVQQDEFSRDAAEHARAGISAVERHSPRLAEWVARHHEGRLRYREL